jgi:hypothetical protein
LCRGWESCHFVAEDHGFVAEVGWFLACFADLCCLVLDRLYVELTEGTLFVELTKAGVIGCGIVIGLIISRRLSLVG